jgi:hypothetical protein
VKRLRNDNRFVENKDNDPHLKETEYFYSFRVCGTLEFLFELREELAEKNKNA